MVKAFSQSPPFLTITGFFRHLVSASALKVLKSFCYIMRSQSHLFSPWSSIDYSCFHQFSLHPNFSAAVTHSIRRPATTYLPAPASTRVFSILGLAPQRLLLMGEKTNQKNPQNNPPPKTNKKPRKKKHQKGPTPNQQLQTSSG